MAYIPPDTTQLAQQNVQGVNDSNDIISVKENKFSRAVNCYPRSLSTGEAWLGRPGFEVFGDALTSLPANSRVQGIFHLRKFDGTGYHYVIMNGVIYVLTGSTWTPLTGPRDPGTALHPTNTIRGVQYDDQLILVDDNDKPVIIGDNLTYAVLTKAPKAIGNPVVYFAKVFFIDKDDPTQIQWSEEGLPNEGYVEDDYNNAWQLTTTSADKFTALWAQEDELILFRENSITSIRGQVSDDFQSNGTREGVSESTGTLFPGSLVEGPGGLFFLDQNCRPHVYTAGRGIQSLETDCRIAVDAILPFATKDNINAVHDEELNLVLIFGEVNPATGSAQAMVFHSERLSYCGVWNGFSAQAVAYLPIPNSDQYSMYHGMARNGAEDNVMAVYRHGREGQGPYADNLIEAHGGITPITHQIVGAPMGYNMDTEYRALMVHIVMRNPGGASEMRFQYETPNGKNNALIFSPGAAAGTSKWGSSIWGAATWEQETAETRDAIMLNGLGRWFKPILTHSNGSEQFAWLGWKLDLQPNNRRWQVK